MKWIGLFDKASLLEGRVGWKWILPAAQKIYTQETFEEYASKIKSPAYVVVELDIDEY